MINLLLEHDMDSKVLIQQGSMQYFIRKKDIMADKDNKDRIIIYV